MGKGEKNEKAAFLDYHTNPSNFASGGKIGRELKFPANGLIK